MQTQNKYLIINNLKIKISVSPPLYITSIFCFPPEKTNMINTTDSITTIILLIYYNTHYFSLRFQFLFYAIILQLKIIGIYPHCPNPEIFVQNKKCLPFRRAGIHLISNFHQSPEENNNSAFKPKHLFRYSL